MTDPASGKSPYGSRKFISIDEYHAFHDAFISDRLNLLRQAIHAAVPGLKETISYNMPAFRLRTNLVYYAVHKQHIGFYPTAAPMVAFAEQLKDFRHSKGAIQFPHNQPLPLDLVQDIVRFRANSDKDQTTKT